MRSSVPASSSSRSRTSNSGRADGEKARSTGSHLGGNCALKSATVSIRLFDYQPDCQVLGNADEFVICRAHQPSLAKRVKAAAPKPTAKAGCTARELRLGKPAFYRLRLGKPSCDHHRENSPKTDALPLPTKISKTTPCKVACCRQDGCVEHSRKNTLTRRANQGH